MSERPDFIYELLFFDKNGAPFKVGNLTGDNRGCTKLGVVRDLADRFMAFDRVPRVDIRRRDRQPDGMYAAGKLIESWTDRGDLVRSKYRIYTEHGPTFSDELPGN